MAHRRCHTRLVTDSRGQLSKPSIPSLISAEWFNCGCAIIGSLRHFSLGVARTLLVIAWARNCALKHQHRRLPGEPSMCVHAHGVLIKCVSIPQLPPSRLSLEDLTVRGRCPGGWVTYRFEVVDVCARKPLLHPAFSVFGGRVGEKAGPPSNHTRLLVSLC